MQERIKRVTEIFGPAGSRSSEAEYMTAMTMIRKDIVNFHGEMVLLVNYSNINYTGFSFSFFSFFLYNLGIPPHNLISPINIYIRDILCNEMPIICFKYFKFFLE